MKKHLGSLLCLLVLAGACWAQQPDASTRAGDAANDAQSQVDKSADRVNRADNDKDWGWIGLLGLGGLLGLRKRRDEVRRDVRDRDDVGMRRAG
jgi:MYXO-CTERM domain-containing protein